jgi:exodeoxyribonuclease VII large subunit
MDFISLAQLNDLIGKKIKTAFSDTYWLMAETSDVRVNNRHCYLEFVEKNPQNHALIARARGYIWANTFEMLKPYFERATGRNFDSGLKVLVKVSVEFHPVYGYGLNVCDIDPSYTLGDLQVRRQAILRQLEEEGILSLNKELEMPLLPQRIAVISSSTAAGYEDFHEHLAKNRSGFIFYTQLFPALMQGEQTESSIISALDKIYAHKDLFDIVVIIRGGGATADLASFDAYNLAANCAQFPLPIVTGIGHERDDTVLDFVSFFRAKTPTAVADFLINRMEETESALLECQTDIINGAQTILKNVSGDLHTLISHLPLLSNNWIEGRKAAVDRVQFQIKNAVQQSITLREMQWKEKDAFFKLSSPVYILAKGYSITLKNGKAVKSSGELQAGDIIETVLAEGKAVSTVNYFSSK